MIPWSQHGQRPGILLFDPVLCVTFWIVPQSRRVQSGPQSCKSTSVFCCLYKHDLQPACKSGLSKAQHVLVLASVTCTSSDRQYCLLDAFQSSQVPCADSRWLVIRLRQFNVSLCWQVLFSAAPCMWLRPRLTEKMMAVPHYNCPVYRTPERKGVLATTGHSTNFVMFVKLPTDQDPQHWMLRGTALLTSLSD